MASAQKYQQAHDSPDGPGDARPTAMQIIEDEGLMGKLKGLVFLVTGGSSGIGVETARTLHAAGADIIMPVRNMQKGEDTVKDIQASNRKYNVDGMLKLYEMDMASLASVRKCAEEILSAHNQLNVLINNAGVMACPEGKTEDGFETQFGTNHVAHFLLFQLLKPLLLSSSTATFNSRVVNVSSLGHRSSTVLLDDLDFKKAGYNPWVAYGQAKTANIWMANEIERRYGSQGLHSTSLMPGAIMTNLLRHLDEGFMKKFQEDKAMAKLMKSPEQGAATTVWAAVGKEWEGRGGRYLEDCREAPPAPDKQELSLHDGGYKPHAYDQDGAKKLWELSCKFTGTEE